VSIYFLTTRNSQSCHVTPGSLLCGTFDGFEPDKRACVWFSWHIPKLILQAGWSNPRQITGGKQLKVSSSKHSCHLSYSVRESPPQSRGLSLEFRSFGDIFCFRISHSTCGYCDIEHVAIRMVSS